MKKLKLFALLFLAGTLIFTSCSKDDEEETTPMPTVTFSGASSYEVDLTDSTTTHIVYSASIKAEGKVKTFVIYEKKYVSNGEGGYDINSTTYFDGTDDFGGETSKTYYFDKNFNATDFVLNGKEVAKIEYVYSVTDKESQNFEKVCTITKKEETPAETPLSDATAFSWKRVGGSAGTGLSTFGLKWTSNAKEVHAQITKDSADKLVILSSADWTNITTKEALAAAVDNATGVEVYANVSAESDDNYDDVIATKVGTEYFLIHVTKGMVNSDQSGTTIEIQGESKN